MEIANDSRLPTFSSPTSDSSLPSVSPRSPFAFPFLSPPSASLPQTADSPRLPVTVSFTACFSPHCSRFGLSISKFRGQGYDDASNMNGEFNDLKTLIMKENPSVFYIYCFAHQFQLIFVGVAENHFDVVAFFEDVSFIINYVGDSCKRYDTLRAKEVKSIAKGPNLGIMKVVVDKIKNLGSKEQVVQDHKVSKSKRAKPNCIVIIMQFVVYPIQTKGFIESHMASAISLRVGRGYQVVTGKMRSCKYLDFGTFKWYSHSNRAFKWKLLEKKVSVIKSYDDKVILCEQEDSRRGPPHHINYLIDVFNLALTCEKFPSIILGDSHTVELYEDTQKDKLMLLAESHWKYQSSAIHNFIKPIENSDGWPNKNMSSLENYSGVPNSSHVMNVKEDAETNVSFKEPSTSDTVSLTVTVPAELILDSPIKCLPDISSRQCRHLESAGLHTMRKLLHHFPRTYADVQNIHSACVDGQYLILVGTVVSSRGFKAGYSFSFIEVVVGCQITNPGNHACENERSNIEENKNIYVHLKRYFRGVRFTCKPFLLSLQSKYNEGDRVYVSGKVKKLQREGHYEMREYTIDMLEEGEEANSHLDQRPYPIYPCKVGVKPGFLKDIILRTLKQIPADIDPIPTSILEEFKLLTLRHAYFGIHCPRDKDEADLARRRLIFDDFFYLQLARLFQMLNILGTCSEKERLLDKYKNLKINVVPMEEWSPLTKKFLKALPFSLTSSQLNAVSEIIWDLKRPVPMNRLLQGDVGCGKTVVAFLACMEVIGSGFQAAFMVPSELLANQHYEQCLSFLGNICGDQRKPSIALLTGSTSLKQSRLIRQGLLTGDIAMVIGTHSLIAEKIEFSGLRIAVIDEQHRFGVVQRGRFNSKLYSASARLNHTDMGEHLGKENMAPHVLAMSATPIPRTLALALYGDMSLTQITDLLPGRVAVETFALEGNESGFEKVYQMMQDELDGKGKVYLVYPVIEESEHLPQLRAASSDYKSISSKFERYNCGLLHGRLTNEQKDEALKRFRSGDTHILLATQVIEIGIDVPDASMMVVMNAERFGIAQLHQLRGRVGRGDKKSRCVFLSSTTRTLDRLKVLEKSSDGFYIANIDLIFRGPGNLLGKRQSGHLPEFPITRLEIDGNILQEAYLAALKVLSRSSDLESFPKLKVELSMRQPLSLLGD